VILRSSLCAAALAGAPDCLVDDTRVIADEGRACVQPAFVGPAVARVHPGATALEVEVVLDACPSPCPFVEDVGCELEREGDTLVLHSWGAWRPTREVCLAVCQPLVARCSIAGLSAGHYRLVHGDERFDVTWPLVAPEPLCR
jgi:hypothetical protein